MPLFHAGQWELGYYGKVAQEVGGTWLAVWVLIAAAFSQVGWIWHLIPRLQSLSMCQIRVGIGGQWLFLLLALLRSFGLWPSYPYIVLP